MVSDQFKVQKEAGGFCLIFPLGGIIEVGQA